MNKTTSSVFTVNVNGTAAPSPCLCAPEVLPINRDQLRVCVKCLTPTKTLKPVLWTPNAQSAQPGRGFYVKVLVSFFPG